MYIQYVHVYTVCTYPVRAIGAQTATGETLNSCRPITHTAATRVSLNVCGIRGNGAGVPTALGGHPGGVRWSPASLEARSLSGDVVMSALSRTREDKWSQPGWRIEQKYANKVLTGNWVEERLKVN